MNKNPFLAVIISIVTLTGIAGAMFYFQFKEDKSGNTLSDEVFGLKYPVAKFPTTGPESLAYSDIRDPGGIPQGLPIRLKIPAINVNSAIEDALITSDGRMDVPVGSRNVAWFALGPHPGRTGSAVIGGHFGIENGVKFVFYDLDKLVIGDKIYIEDDKGDTIDFVVRSIELFDRNADATTVFTSEDGLAHLNLITCEGIWNKVNNTYPKRRVVFADAILEGEAALNTSTSTISKLIKSDYIKIFSRTFSKGSSGNDVITLQTFLEEKKLLSIPEGTTKGYFGDLTRVALSKYQTNSGLSPIGAFGPLTRSKIIEELRSNISLPNAGIIPMSSFPIGVEALTNKEGSTEFPDPLLLLKQTAESLYDNPMDGIITSILLLFIGFIIFKIVRINSK